MTATASNAARFRENSFLSRDLNKVTCNGRLRQRRVAKVFSADTIEKRARKITTNQSGYDGRENESDLKTQPAGVKTGAAALRRFTVENPKPSRWGVVKGNGFLKFDLRLLLPAGHNRRNR